MQLSHVATSGSMEQAGMDEFENQPDVEAAPEAAPCVTGKRNFSVEQLATLQSMFASGMKGVGKQYSPLIEHAAEDTGLTIQQVKVQTLALHQYYQLAVVLLITLPYSVGGRAIHTHSTQCRGPPPSCHIIRVGVTTLNWVIHGGC